MSTPRISIIVACNDEDCLKTNLLASPLLAAPDVELWVERGAPSAAVAYNRGLDQTSGEIVLFAHQDVYLPRNFATMLQRALDQLEALDPDWALTAPFGMDMEARHTGHVWSTSQGCVLGGPLPAPVPAQSFDELLIVLRRSSGLRFDPALPLYHMYGTDIVQIARAAGRGAYVTDLPVVHNDKFHGRLGADFTQAYEFIRRKWRKVLPLRSPVLPISWHGLDLKLYRLRAWRSFAGRQAKALDPTGDPRHFSRKSGWDIE